MAVRLEEAGADAKVSIEVQPNRRAKLNVAASAHSTSPGRKGIATLY